MGFSEGWYQRLTDDERAAVQAKAAATRARNKAHLDAQRAARERERQRKQAMLDGARRRRNRSSNTHSHRKVPGGSWVVFEPLPDLYAQRRSARFWAYVDRSGGPDACWPWHGTRRGESDYGQFSWYGTACPSHRVSWMLHHGLIIPYELVVDHLCEVKWCQNWDHLEPVTSAENKRRVHHRPPEATRIRTSFEPPWADRWYPFGRRLYDADGERLA